MKPRVPRAPICEQPSIAVPQENSRCRSIKVSYFLRDLSRRHLVRGLKAHYPFAKMPLLELFA